MNDYDALEAVRTAVKNRTEVPVHDYHIGSRGEDWTICLWCGQRKAVGNHNAT